MSNGLFVRCEKFKTGRKRRYEELVEMDNRSAHIRYSSRTGRERAHSSRNYGKRPETSAAFLGYDAMKMSIDTLASLSSPGDSEAIVRALHSRKPFHGATGDISFSHGNEPNKALYLIRHENAAIKTIGGLP